MSHGSFANSPPRSAEKWLPEFADELEELLKEYSGRFALKFEDVGGVPPLKPLHPVSAPRK